MGRDSIQTYRPAHSAHGDLYWRVVMWPLQISARIRRVKRQSKERDRRLEDDSAIRGRSSKGTPPATPLSALPGPWLSPRQGRIWLSGEGSVRPMWHGPRHEAEARGAR